MQRHWKILQWITSGWSCRGGFSVSLRRDEGCIYLCFLLRPVGFCFSKSCDCAVAHITKSACPPAAEKRLPTAICPHSRWRSQPLSSVSRKQRYNTLDFASKIVCQQGCCAPLLETQRQRGFSPLNSPYFLRRWVSKLQKCSLERLLRKCKRKSVPMRGGLPFLLTI